MIRQCAIEMGHEKLIAKLSEGDMISRDACYHHKCITTFTNAYRKFVNDNNRNSKDRRLEEIAFLEAMHFLEETLLTSSMMAPYVKLSEIKHYYCQVMESLNAEFLSVNATRLRERLLQKNANLEATPHNMEVFISFKDDLAAALKYAEENDARSNLNHILQTSRVIRKEIFQSNQQFDGSFLSNGLEGESISHSLLLLVNLIIGFTSPSDIDKINPQTVSAAMAQLLQFNCVEKKTTGTTRTRHNANKETPLSIYSALHTLEHSLSHID